MSDPFVKVYRSLFDSSLWASEPLPTRMAWLSLLVAAELDGKWMGTLPGLARLAGITLEEAHAAMVSFMKPDPDSRSRAREGRRIEEIDGGYRIINYERYREKRSRRPA